MLQRTAYKLHAIYSPARLVVHMQESHWYLARYYHAIVLQDKTKVSCKTTSNLARSLGLASIIWIMQDSFSNLARVNLQDYARKWPYSMIM